MTPEIIAEFLKLFLLGWLGALTAFILVKMLRGDINTTGLMCSTKGGEPDPERVTMDTGAWSLVPQRRCRRIPNAVL